MLSIICNDEGCPVFAGTRSVSSHYVFITEAFALREGLLSALCQNLFKVRVTLNSLFIV